MKQVIMLARLICLILVIHTFSIKVAADDVKPRYTIYDREASYYNNSLNNLSYPVKLLLLTLEVGKTKFGDYDTKILTTPYPKTRVIHFVKSQNNAIIWSTTAKKLEEELSAVYVPIIKGILGYRVFLIRSEEQARFDSITKLAELRQFTIGQGKAWNDNAILRHNGFTVIGAEANGLVNMLLAKRFDIYSRGIHEPWIELKAGIKMSIENNLMLNYPLPIYFFVNSANKDLHQRLTWGLEHIIKTGQFDQLFKNHPIYSEAMNKINFHKRKSFTLINPNLSPQTKALLKKDKYWLK
ncbi:hypothetical protein [Algibacillus agarilyticus]|uniref:hypothetical protein n=1 Tax=Algibacillus agarilyticus TaxID=2234133 RepID=UPI0013008E44|nr:hypothetical protein [Algibacillus agarilyticus]